MNKKKQHTKTLDFEVDGIEEAYEPDASGRWEPPTKAESGIEVELPPELEEEEPPPEMEAFEPRAKVWILERRARGHWAALRRWVTGKAKSGKK